MSVILTPFSLVIACIARWLNQHQQRIIDYVIEENRVLRSKVTVFQKTHLQKRLQPVSALLRDGLYLT